MGKRMISDFVEGEEIKSYFLVREKIRGTTKEGKPYLSIDLLDRSGTISGKIWDRAAELYDRFQKGDMVAVRGTVDSFRGKKQLKIDDLRPIDERDEGRLDRGDLLPQTPCDQEALWTRLLEIIQSVSDPELKELLTLVFSDPELSAAFRYSTAARDLHHNYIGGLLEHTMSVVTVADFLCRHYGPEIDRDLVIAGALLHDIGKTRELNTGAEFNYTIEGSLKGHIQIGAEMTQRFAAQVPTLAPARLLLLEHLILSHQGQKEWSAPVEPKIPEAMLLHLADLTDARMFQTMRAIRDDKNTDDPFTQKVPVLGRALLKIRDTATLKTWLDIEEDKRKEGRK